MLAGQIDLVDRDHDFDMGRGLGVIDRFDRLRHETVVRRDHEDDDVGHVGAAGAHGGEGGVTGRVEESDFGPFVIDRVSADVLGDAARFAGRDTRLANRVHERGFAVIDVAHEGDDGRAQLELFFLLDDGRRRRDHDFDLFMDAAAFFATLHLEDEAVFVANLGRDFRLHGQVRVGENVEVVHQLFDELEIFQAELGREILDDDRRLDVNDLAAVLGFGFDLARFFRVVGGGGWRRRLVVHRFGHGRCRADAGNRRENRALDRLVGRRALRFRDVRINQGNAFHDRLRSRRLRCGRRRRRGRLGRVPSRRNRGEGGLGGSGRSGLRLGAAGLPARGDRNGLPVGFFVRQPLLRLLQAWTLGGLGRATRTSRGRLGRSGGLRRLARRRFWPPWFWSSFSLALKFLKMLLMAVSG